MTCKPEILRPANVQVALKSPSPRFRERSELWPASTITGSYSVLSQLHGSL
jgi:hypothetical protein